MAVGEPQSPLWAAVKAISDPWPPDNEDTAVALGGAWTRSSAVVRGAGQQMTGVAGTVGGTWQDGAGQTAKGSIDTQAARLGQFDQQLGTMAQSVTKYADTLRDTKNSIVGNIAANEGIYSFLGSPVIPGGPLLQAGFAAAVAANLRSMVQSKAGTLQHLTADGLKTTDPNVTVGKDGKLFQGKASEALGAFKGTSDDGHLTVEGNALKAEGTAWGAAGEKGPKAESGIGTDPKLTPGSGPYAQLQAQASVGSNLALGYSNTAGPLGYGAKGEVSAMARAEAGLTVNSEEVEGKAGAFVGGRAVARGNLSFAGIGVGGAAEAWAGPGAEASFKLGMGEDHKFHLGASAGASPVLGAKLGFEVTVDPAEVGKSFDEAKNWASDQLGKIF
ncbi:WXG100 family type VII secretion target [Amycolatopsis sp. H20-H5]|uniref:WXG100 family type VII secretion target n=1 Tax=Amycolatopsis sp. H20-H5 TaxID=3046309 RepID=UPI002DBB236F|nr:hypothetical protein [Amycolatopsis sp. H20-H5]MEC3974228.1 hypothetical protein [Amycolatopsis sp. H20-H5]